MISWLRSLLKKNETPLTGAPLVRRQKTYSAQSGYVYQYFYEGQRTATRGAQPGTQYVFDVSADRKTSFQLSVFLPRAAVETWERSHERALMANEQYAIAKMALFRAFDERANPDALHREVRVDIEAVQSLLENLDID